MDAEPSPFPTLEPADTCWLSSRVDSKLCPQNGLRPLGRSRTVTGIQPVPHGSSTWCTASPQAWHPSFRLSPFAGCRRVSRFPGGRESWPGAARGLSGLSYLLKGLGKSLPPLDQSCWHRHLVILGFQPLRLGRIHYACPFGASLKRHLLPLMGVGFWTLLSKYKMPDPGDRPPRFQGYVTGC